MFCRLHRKVEEEGKCTRDQILGSLNRTYKPNYNPIASEFGIGVDYDFEDNFDKLMGPLLKKGYVRSDGDMFRITPKGKIHIGDLVRIMKYEI